MTSGLFHLRTFKESELVKLKGPIFLAFRRFGGGRELNKKEQLDSSCWN